MQDRELRQINRRVNLWEMFAKTDRPFGMFKKWRVSRFAKVKDSGTKPKAVKRNQGLVRRDALTRLQPVQDCLLL